MKYGNLHTHTTFCDGRNDPESLIIKALERGLDTIGFSGHSELYGCDNWCMNGDRAFRYRAKIHELARKYKGWINVLCGVEQDYYSNSPTHYYDYIIGSVHCFNIDGKLLPVDANRELLKKIVNIYFDGEFLNMAQKYFELVSDVVEKTDADIIGHFDLITKFNKLGCFFDENNESYQNLAKTAVNRLIGYQKPFELNTGGMARGHIDRAYPAPFLIDYIKSLGGKFILTSDCHDIQYLDYGFEDYFEFADGMTLDDIKYE